MTIRNLSAQAIALQVVAHFALSNQSGSDRVSEPYKCYVDPNNGGAVTPYITALMGRPDGGGPSVPFLAYVPKTPLQLQAGESRLLTVDTAPLPWYLGAAKVPFASLPSGDRDLVFTLRADDGALRGMVVSNSTAVVIQ